jgi:hypothetical protein
VSGASVRGFSCPTVLDGLRELAAVVGPDEALAAWSVACTENGVHGVDLPAASHLQVATWLSVHAPAPAVRAVARSITTRLRAYDVLTRTPVPSQEAEQ